MSRLFIHAISIPPVVAVHLAVKEDSILNGKEFSRSALVVAQASNVVPYRVVRNGTDAPWLTSSNVLSASSKQAQLYRTFRPCAQCENYKRYGEADDGGYVMCELQEHHQELLGIYSYGVEEKDNWSSDVRKMYPDTKIFEYDCTVNKSPLDEPNVVFKKECVNGKPFADGELSPLKTVSEHLATNGHKVDDLPEGSLIMKMDVEDSEWGALKAVTKKELRLFRQMVVEFHWMDRENFLENKIETVENILKAGFVIVHVHGNNFAQLQRVAQGDLEVSFPTVIEVTFALKDFQDNGLSSDKNECQNIQVLTSEDAANKPDVDDLDIAFPLRNQIKATPNRLFRELKHSAKLVVSSFSSGDGHAFQQSTQTEN